MHLTPVAPISFKLSPSPALSQSSPSMPTASPPAPTFPQLQSTPNLISEANGNITGASDPARSHPFTWTGFAAQQSLTMPQPSKELANKPPAHTLTGSALLRGAVMQVPPPVGREDAPLNKRLLDQFQRTNMESTQPSPAPSTPWLKRQPKFHFGLAPIGGYQQPSVSDEVVNNEDVDMSG
ncbi:hypothetical protein F66182_1952 [Fusarium sp. NRRL 66182]|nr:hypothetical protein F66182_1952 [Fusarium sp. NRRL 66182]